MDTNAHRFGLLGRKLGHSYSALIHKELGSAPYDLIELEPEEVEPFVREGSWQGLNVTIPYKRDAARLADVRSERVERLGVSNTLVKRADGSIFAENTDVLGFAYLLERFSREELGAASAKDALSGKPVLVLGSGGASQAVQAALRDAEAEVSVISRKGDDTYETLLERHADASLIVNTTPVGMYPSCPATPVDEETLAKLPRLEGILDVVYNPRRTGICLAAEKLGLPSASGLSMLVAQAYFASELFQDKDIPEEAIAKIEQDILATTDNLLLIGMPGSGKTTTGKHLAHVLHRPFIDMDDAYQMEYGRSAAEAITEDGEKAFRQQESALLAKTASRSGLVISCGGGVVTVPQNYPLLHQNSFIIMLDRPIETLETKGRPLSQSKGLEKLAEERLPLYRAWADLVLPCTGTPKGDAAAIIARLGL